MSIMSKNCNNVLRDHGDSLINLCHTYNLPSSLAQHRCSATEVLSSDDINHWSDCQTKDIDRLFKTSSIFK